MTLVHHLTSDIQADIEAVTEYLFEHIIDRLASEHQAKYPWSYGLYQSSDIPLQRGHIIAFCTLELYGAYWSDYRDLFNSMPWQALPQSEHVYDLNHCPNCLTKEQWDSLTAPFHYPSQYSFGIYIKNCLKGDSYDTNILFPTWATYSPTTLATLKLPSDMPTLWRFSQ